MREGGSSSFYLAEGWFDPQLARPGHTVRFFEGDHLLAEQPAQWVIWERSEDVNVIVPLPAAPERIDVLSWHAPEHGGIIERDSLAVVGRLWPSP